MLQSKSIPAPLAHSIPALIVLVVIVVLVAIVLVVVLRRFLTTRGAQNPSTEAARPSSENPAAFATASMQAVIQRLRGQEKELARLHQLEKERALESERLSEAVTRNMPAGLLLVGASGAIATANPAAETILARRGLLYRSYGEILGADSQLAGMITACLRVGTTFQRGEVEHAIPSGEVRRLGVTISPILRPTRDLYRAANDPRATEERVSGALCLMSDLTELSELQKQIRWKENLAALGEMSAGIAHEFKNSLATISGYAQMIRSEAGEGEMAESASRIIEQTRALTHVVTEFLRFARPLEVASETVGVGGLVERVLDEVREAIPGIAIESGGHFAEVAGDEGLLRQALLNLARNAAEAVSGAGADGRVVICGAVEERSGRMWQRISLADNGPGIAVNDLTKIFLPFYTTKADGTGLGLALVQKIALQHGGSVEARNRPEGGAEFVLWLPLRQQTAGSVIAPSASRI